MSGLSWHQQRAMGMHACPDDIVGYTYQADNYCPECILTVLVGTYNRITSSEVEADLDSIASTHGIDRQDESSFDSGEFPKVLFRDMLSKCPLHVGGVLNGDCEWECCGRCHRVLGE